MKARLDILWERLRSSYWFVPTLMTGAAAVLSFATLAVDGVAKDPWPAAIRLLWAGSAEGARALLSTVAGSIITVAGVVLSITMVALSNASSQFGPRLLRSYMRDTLSQIVLGMFVATFVYGVLVLRTIRTGTGTEFVPHLSVTIAILLALGSVGLLISFIHHVASFLRIEHIVADIGHDLDHAVRRLFPEKLGQAAPVHTLPRIEAEVPQDFDRTARPVVAAASGYLQAIDTDGLMRVATMHDLLLRLERRPGHFIVEGNPLVSVWPPERVTEELTSAIYGSFVLGAERIGVHDLEYGVHQLVQVAVRALSPGINDPYTAATCVGWLGAALSQLAQRDILPPYRYGEDGKLRVIANHALTFAGVLDTAFNQIRQYGRSSAAVTIRLLETIAAVAVHVHRDEDRAALLRHAEMITRGTCEAFPEALDRQDLEERYRAAVKALALH